MPGEGRYVRLTLSAKAIKTVDHIGVEAAVVVTQDYHVRRAAFSCAAAGIDVQGSGVSSASVEPSKAVMYRVRELPASWKAALDAVVNRSPVYLGDPEPGVRDALAG